MLSFPSGTKTIGLDAIEPAQNTLAQKPHPAILLLHGAGGNVSFWFNALRPHLSRFGVALYAVHYFDRTGTQRAEPALIQDGHHFPLWLDTINDALNYLRQRPGVDPQRICLLGISLGAFLALAHATQPASTPVRAIIDVSGGLPDSYGSQASSSFPPTLILHGDADTVVPVSHAHALDQLLNALETPHALQIFAAEGHWFSAAAQFHILACIARFLNTWL